MNNTDNNTVDFNKMLVRDLKGELSARGLPVSGRKAELVARLEAHTQACQQQEPKSKRNRAVPNAPTFTSSVEENGEGPADPVGNGYTIGAEQRLRPFVDAPDSKFQDKLKRIQKDRMFMLDRKRGIDKDGYPFETFDIAGSTGNIYQATIGRSPKCVCMDAVSDKPLLMYLMLINISVYVAKNVSISTVCTSNLHPNLQISQLTSSDALIKILKAPPKLCYQFAFLSNELEYIFAKAPVTQAPQLPNPVENDTLHNGKRKPLEANCPICVCDMEESEGIVWCKAACGQNFHADCMDQWKRSKQGGRVTCPYCRTPWQEGDTAPAGSLAALKAVAPKIGSYRNVAHLMPQYQAPENITEANDDDDGVDDEYEMEYAKYI
jgi:hypothetical protein